MEHLLRIKPVHLPRPLGNVSAFNMTKHLLSNRDTALIETPVHLSRPCVITDAMQRVQCKSDIVFQYKYSFQQRKNMLLLCMCIHITIKPITEYDGFNGKRH